MFNRKSNFSAAERKLLIVLSCMQFIAIAEFMVLMPLAPMLMRDFSFTPPQFGMIVASYAFASGVSGVVCAFFIDRFDRRQSLLALFLGLILSTFLCAAAWNYWSLLGGRVLAGIFSGVLGAQIQAIVSETTKPQHRGEALGIIFASFSLSTVVGVPLGLVLATNFYWGAPFMFLASLGAIVWFFGLKVVPSLTNHQTNNNINPWKDILPLLRSKVTLKSFLFTMLTISATSLVFPFISPYLVANVGVPQDRLFLVYLFGGGSTFFTSRLIGKLADKYGPAQVFRTVSLIAIIPLLLMTHLPPLPLFEVVLVSAIFFIFVSGRMPPSVSLLTQTISPKIRGKFLSMNAAIQSFALAIGSYGSSLLITRAPDGTLSGFGDAGLMAACIIICSCLWSFRLKRIEIGHPDAPLPSH